MFKIEADAMIEKAGGQWTEQSIEFSLLHGGQPASLQVGQSWVEATAMGFDLYRPQATFEIVGFAAPEARGRIEKWDDDREVPSVILKSDSPHEVDQWHIRSAWDCRKGFVQ